MKTQMHHAASLDLPCTGLQRWQNGGYGFPATGWTSRMRRKSIRRWRASGIRSNAFAFPQGINGAGGTEYTQSCSNRPPRHVWSDTLSNPGAALSGGLRCVPMPAACIPVSGSFADMVLTTMRIGFWQKRAGSGICPRAGRRRRRRLLAN